MWHTIGKCLSRTSVVHLLYATKHHARFPPMLIADNDDDWLKMFIWQVACWFWCLRIAFSWCARAYHLLEMRLKKKWSAAHAEGQLYAEKKNVRHIRPANLGASGAIFFTQFTLFTTTNLLCYFKYMQRHIALGYRCQISYKFASNSCNILSLKCIFIIMGYSSIYSIWILNENQFLAGWPGGLVS